MRYFFCRRLLPLAALIIFLTSPALAAVSGNSGKHKESAGKAKVAGAVKARSKKSKAVVVSKDKGAEKKAAAIGKTKKATKRQKYIAGQDEIKIRKAKNITAASPDLSRKKGRVTARLQSDFDTPAELKGRLTCRSAFIMDARTGEVILDHRADQPGQPASTIKVLTGLIALESLRGSELVPASSYAVNMPASKINLRQGSYYQADDLISAVLLSSANDASVALAEKLAGSEQAFARLMTKKAEALGAQNTVCKSANGLTRPGQQTTARDLATVFNRAMKNPEFAERMAASKVRTSDGRVLRSHNKALWTVDGAVGGKTGFTNAAGKTYVGKFRRGGREIIVSLLGSASMWTDVAKLVEYGFSRQDTAGREKHDDHARLGAVAIKGKQTA